MKELKVIDVESLSYLLRKSEEYLVSINLQEDSWDKYRGEVNLTIIVSGASLDSDLLLIKGFKVVTDLSDTYEVRRRNSYRVAVQKAIYFIEECYRECNLLFYLVGPGPILDLVKPSSPLDAYTSRGNLSLIILDEESLLTISRGLIQSKKGEEYKAIAKALTVMYNTEDSTKLRIGQVIKSITIGTTFTPEEVVKALYLTTPGYNELYYRFVDERSDVYEYLEDGFKQRVLYLRDTCEDTPLEVSGMDAFVRRRVLRGIVELLYDASVFIESIAESLNISAEEVTAALRGVSVIDTRMWNYMQNGLFQYIKYRHSVSLETLINK